MCLFALGCKNNAEVEIPKTDESTVKKPTDIPNPVDISDRAILVSETTETIEGKNYTVKSYAVVYGNDYVYKFYKYYYLNDKLLECRFFDHTIGCRLDYKYTEFVEHNCIAALPHYDYDYLVEFDKQIVKYYEDGRVKSNTLYFGEEEWATYTYYDNSKNSLRSEFYPKNTFLDNNFKRPEKNKYFNETGVPLIEIDTKYINYRIRYDSGFVKYEYSDYSGNFCTYNDMVWKSSYHDIDNNRITAEGDQEGYTSKEAKSSEDAEAFFMEQLAAFESSH